MSRALSVAPERWPIRGTFTISRGSKRTSDVVVATIREGGHEGRGEGMPYAHYGESVEGVREAIEALDSAIAAGMDRTELQEALPAGAARNALDCALWDLECKRRGRRAWELAGLPPPAPLDTACTLSLDTPEAMRAAATAHPAGTLLKLKLGNPGDLDRVKAVRDGAPEACIIVDANEGWSAVDYAALAPELARLGVAMIEQPLPAGDDAPLARLPRPVPLCADESCHDRATLDALAGRYDLVNVMLDKTGGLSEALALREAARARGFGIMVGCMISTSLAMAPALLVADGAAFVDLDGPLLLARDRPHGLRYEGARVHPPAPALWG